MDVLDHASVECGFGGKVGMDATKKIAGEGHYRDWPDPIVMDEGTKARVDKVCQDLGF
jgi:4-hydroxy-3-polyprenylbenzoate decarboxylase